MTPTVVGYRRWDTLLVKMVAMQCLYRLVKAEIPTTNNKGSNISS